MRHASLALLLVGVSGCFLFGEEPADDEASGAGCATDEDCDPEAGEQCTIPDGENEGTCDCVAASCGAGGDGGGRPPIPEETRLPEDACSWHHDCLPSRGQLGLTVDVVTDELGQRTTCRPDERRCEETQSCRTALVCGAPVGPTPGATACGSDDECTSGLCVRLGPPSVDDPAMPGWRPELNGDRGVCFRSCAESADCPFVEDDEGAPVGLECRTFVYGRRRLRSCLPTDDAWSASLCRGDRDCLADQSCRFDSAVVGRDDPAPVLVVVGVPVCLTPGEGLATGAPGCQFSAAVGEPRPDPDACAGGLCTIACNVSSELLRPDRTDPMAHWCQDDVACTAPCARDADCPERLACGTTLDLQRVGGHLEPGNFEEGRYARGRDVGACRLAQGSCLDELDCRHLSQRPDGHRSWHASLCPERCIAGRSPDGVLQSRCDTPRGVREATPPESEAACPTLTRPDAEPGMLPPGSPCSVHETCDTGLCAPRAADGVLFCTSPCAPFGEGRSSSRRCPASRRSPRRAAARSNLRPA